MKKLIYLFVAVVFSCNKDEIVNAGPLSIESQTIFSIEPDKAEFVAEVFNVNSTLKEVGVAIGSNPNPGSGDRVISIKNIVKSQAINILIDQLVLGKTYYLRSFYKGQDDVIVFGNQLVLKQEYNDRQVKLPSPILSGDEFIISDYARPSSGFGGVQFIKVDPSNQKGTYTYFYPNFGDWDPRFFNLDFTPITPVRYNQIGASFVSGGDALELVGAGYQKLENGGRFYLKDLIVRGASGYKYEPQYPGANAEINSFGHKSSAFVIERMPKGTIWQFEFEKVRWVKYDNLPFDFEANYQIFKVKDRTFVLVEPKDFMQKNAGFYEYQVDEKKWIRLADFSGEERRRSSGFVAKGKIYYGCGQSTQTQDGLRDFWVFDPDQNAWKPAFNYNGGGTVNITAVSFEGYVLLGFGQSVIVSGNKGEKFKQMKDFWRLLL